MRKNLYSLWLWVFLFIAFLGVSVWYLTIWSHNQISLTVEEREWLNHHPTITVCPNPFFPPYEFYDPEGSYIGLSADLLHAIGKELGVTITIVRIDGREERWKALHEGRVDLLGSVKETSSRQKDFLFSRPFTYSKDVIIVRSTIGHSLTVDSLIGMRVAVPKNNAVHEEISIKYPGIHIVSVGPGYESVYAVSFGNADAAILNLGAASYYIAKMGLHNLRVAGVYHGQTQLSFGFNGDRPILKSIFDKALNALPERERERIDNKWLGLQYRTQWWDSIPWQWIVGIFSLIALVVLLIVVWNRSLRREVLASTSAIRHELDERLKAEEAKRESEERFTLSMEATNDGLWDWNVLTGKTYYSPGYYTMLGYEPDYFSGNVNAWKVLVHPDDLEYALGVNMECIQGHSQSFDVEYRMKARNGEWHWILSRGKCIARDEHGRALRLLGTHVDITERKRSEQLLVQEKERLAVTLRSIGDGVITTDIAGTIVLLNKAAEEMTGWISSDAAGRPLTDVFVIVNELTREPCSNPIEKILGTGNAIELATHSRLISKNGREIRIADSGAPIRDAESNITGIVLVFRDVTEKERLNESMQRAQKLESLGILAGGIAHDFNNMLAGIFGYLDLAKETLAANNPHLIPKYLEKALGVFDRAKGLTQQLLTFSKGGSPVRKTLQLAPLLEHSARFVLSGSNVICRFNIADDLWLSDCDENQIGQVIDNIVINGKQSMPMGGTIVVSAVNRTDEPGRPGRFIRISVQDQGIGIPKEILPKIFDPFFSTKETGHGLGLATVFSIVQRHDGWIDVESSPGKGSTFHVFLPASYSHIVAVSTPHRAAHTGTGTILVMDDEVFMLDIVSSMLQRMGYTVACAKDGPEALILFEEAEATGRPFTASILDMTIPGGAGGKEIAIAIRAIDPNAVIIASSGYSEDPIIANPAGHGFTDRIIKPYRQAELAEVMSRIPHA